MSPPAPGTVAALSNVTQHLEMMLLQGRGRLFVAGDNDARSAAGMFFPPGFVIPELFGRFAAAAAEHLPQVRARIAAGDWPSWLAATASGEGSVTCWVCNRGFKNAWCHRGVCYACEADTRASGRCAFGKGTCKQSTWCGHDNKCIVCDAWSCALCKIVRGDGDVVAGLAAAMAPNVTIFLDFDRTIASTKCGADPLVGCHSIDASLLGVINAHR